ncbi:MAG: flagellar hook-basal body complex protein [Peptococcaceae bacterium]|nr:flagellar hook-basal body complex protein [Peptococcaceae bacterium]
MMRSLYSAVSGLQAHQTMMDVIGNNIANVNTAGFKSGRVTFKDLLSQTLQGASAPSTTPVQGGSNAVQVGLGVGVGSIQTMMTQGSAETTGVPTDLMIQGDGFFVLKDNGTTVYTREGSFGTDAAGNLVDPNTGAYVQSVSGANITINPTTYTSFSIDNTGTITGVTPAGTTATIGQIGLTVFNNPGGLVKDGNNYYSPSNNSNTTTPTIVAPNSGGAGSIATGMLEMSNVDLSVEMTNMIAAQRGFQANARVITVSDTLLQELTDLKRS